MCSKISRYELTKQYTWSDCKQLKLLKMGIGYAGPFQKCNNIDLVLAMYTLHTARFDVIPFVIIRYVLFAIVTPTISLIYVW